MKKSVKSMFGLMVVTLTLFVSACGASPSNFTSSGTMSAMSSYAAPSAAYSALESEALNKTDMLLIFEDLFARAMPIYRKWVLAPSGTYLDDGMQPIIIIENGNYILMHDVESIEQIEDELKSVFSDSYFETLKSYLFALDAQWGPVYRDIDGKPYFRLSYGGGGFSYDEDHMDVDVIAESPQKFSVILAVYNPHGENPRGEKINIEFQLVLERERWLFSEFYQMI